jgi:hypothetical protein
MIALAIILVSVFWIVPAIREVAIAVNRLATAVEKGNKNVR